MSEQQNDGLSVLWIQPGNDPQPKLYGIANTTDTVNQVGASGRNEDTISEIRELIDQDRRFDVTVVNEQFARTGMLTRLTEQFAGLTNLVVIDLSGEMSWETYYRAGGAVDVVSEVLDPYQLRPRLIQAQRAQRAAA